jgi:hypothetical protein
MVKNSLVPSFHVLQLLWHLLVAGLAESIRVSRVREEVSAVANIEARDRDCYILIGRTMVDKMIRPSRGPEMCRVDCASFVYPDFRFRSSHCRTSHSSIFSAALRIFTQKLFSSTAILEIRGAAVCARGALHNSICDGMRSYFSPSSLIPPL